MAHKNEKTKNLFRTKSGGYKPSILSDLLSCAEHHERYAREPLTTLSVLARSFKEKKDFIELKRSIRKEHLRYAKAIRSILSAR